MTTESTESTETTDTTAAPQAPPVPGPVNLRRLLLAATPATRGLLPTELVDGALGAVPGIGAQARRALVESATAVTESLLDLDLGAAALRGWRLHERLLVAAEATLASPGLTEIVDLTTHDVRATWHPALEILLGGTPVATLPVAVTLTMATVGLFATVTRGRLTRIGGGRCDVTALVELGGTPLMERTVPVAAELLSISVGRGFPLVAPDPDAA